MYLFKGVNLIDVGDCLYISEPLKTYKQLSKSPLAFLALLVFSLLVDVVTSISLKFK